MIYSISPVVCLYKILVFLTPCVADTQTPMPPHLLPSRFCRIAGIRANVLFWSPGERLTRIPPVAGQPGSVPSLWRPTTSGAPHLPTLKRSFDHQLQIGHTGKTPLTPARKERVIP